MKLAFLIGSALATLLGLPASARADEIHLDQVVARARRELIAPSPYADNPLLEEIHHAQLDATQAEASLAAPLPPGTRLPAGPVTVRAALGILPADDRIRVITLDGAQISSLLERAASIFASYTYEDGRPLLDANAAESLFVTIEGLAYELDLTAQPGHRVIHLTRGGAALDSGQKLRVAMTGRLARRLGWAPQEGGSDPWLGDAWLARLRKLGTLEDDGDRSWSVLPDYATTVERPAIDRMVRLGAAPFEEVRRLLPDQPARRADLAYWLARAFGWRESKLSGAFPDVPDSLEPWLDGLVRRRVIGSVATEELFQPFLPVTLPLALDWCENAARSERYPLDDGTQREAFRRGLLTGTELRMGGGSVKGANGISRAQLLAVIANLRFPWIRVLDTSDFHGQLLPGAGDARARPGSAALAATIARLRAENPEGALLLDGGDAFQGTMISDASQGRAVVAQMNLLGYTAMAIGNHDFDWTADTLAARLADFHGAGLAANLAKAESGELPWWARPDTLVHRSGVRIGVFGLAYSATPAVSLERNVRGLRFDDDSVAAARRAPALRKRGAQVVIGLGHVPGTERGDGRLEGRIARLARGVHGVDLWLGGHGHNRIDAEVDGTPVLIPGAHGEAVALCDLVVDPVRGRVVEHRHRLVDVGADPVAPDSAMAALVDRWNRTLAAQAKVVVGSCARPLPTRRDGESAIGSLIADQMRALTGADVALQNSGGIRAGLPQGQVTRDMVFEVLPFENTIVTLVLTGAEVRRVLEEWLAAGRITQVSGIRYRFDLERPAGARVTALLGPDGRPFDESRTYRVACNDFMAEGGDGAGTLAHGRDLVNSGISLRQALEDRVREASAAGGTLDYREDGRVAAERP